MSGVNGDKARYHRQRKKKIAKRKRTRELINLASRSKSPTQASSSKPRAVKI